MNDRLQTRIGGLTLKNPLIAGSADHLMESEGIMASVNAGAGAVVVKSFSGQAGKKQTRAIADYLALDTQWNPVPWGYGAPEDVTIAARPSETGQSFSQWLEQCAQMTRYAGHQDCLLVASLAQDDPAKNRKLAQQLAAAGIPALELSIKTGGDNDPSSLDRVVAVKTVRNLVADLRETITIPLWVKLSAPQLLSPALAEAAFAAGADAVTVTESHTGFIPDLETFAPRLGGSIGVGGFWTLPLACQALVQCRATVGPEKSLIGAGGARNGGDVARMLLAGASAVGLASSIILRGYQVIPAALQQLEAYLSARDLKVADLIGRAADNAKAPPKPHSDGDHWRQFMPSV
ncbi:MAG: dihydroorotate dehydrogenase [Rhodocyclaceae bacterium]|nr:MAG: dihydroorotate dehydrogenase [Rhodocyclaceae bacterium]